jgi:uncharacterized membrane protein YeiB
MAVYLVGYLMFLAAEPTSIHRWATVVRLALIVGTMAALALSTSSTAFIGLAGAAVWATGRYVLWPLIVGDRRNPRAAVAVVAMGVAVVCVFAASSTLRELVRQMVLEKNDSSSYEERSGSDAVSTGLVAATWGLGVGLGSNRGSSFGPSLLSTVGVAGAVGLAGVMVHLIRPPHRGLSPLAKPWHEPLAAGLLGVVGTKLVSSPDLVTPSMWALMAGLLCVHGTSAADETAPATADETALSFTRRSGMAEAVHA